MCANENDKRMKMHNKILIITSGNIRFLRRSLFFIFYSGFFPLVLFLLSRLKNLVFFIFFLFFFWKRIFFRFRKNAFITYAFFVLPIFSIMASMRFSLEFFLLFFIAFVLGHTTHFFRNLLVFISSYAAISLTCIAKRSAHWVRFLFCTFFLFSKFNIIIWKHLLQFFRFSLVSSLPFPFFLYWNCTVFVCEFSLMLSSVFWQQFSLYCNISSY